MGVSKRINLAMAAVVLAAMVLAIPAMAHPDRAAIELTRTCQVGSASLQAGTYKVEFDGNKVTFFQGHKVVAEATGEWKKSPDRAVNTSVIYQANGRIIEIRLEGRDSYFAIQ